MRNDLRDRALTEVETRVMHACLMQASLPEGQSLDILINDTLYHEKKRLERGRSAPNWAADLAFWDQIQSRLSKADDAELQQLLGSIISRFVQEIRGNFSPFLYGMSTRVLPRALPALLNAMSPKRLLSRGMPHISETIKIQGHVDALKRMNQLGTVILAPTHLSNLDSPAVGWAIYAMGLEPFAYGAGLNLFTNPVLSLFMRNLGAYRVDREKSAPLYKDVLKAYTATTLEFGQPNLFFPGGTRARSGEVENHLKLGLLSAGLRAYINNLLNYHERPKIFIVPCTLNYHLVLEAESLIDDHLAREGKGRYILLDDESTRAAKVWNFLQNILSLDAPMIMHVGRPIDPFGNLVDLQTGDSIDRHGRVIDIRQYVTNRDGEPVHVPQRDRVYVDQAGQSLTRAFRRDTVVLTTHLVAFTMWELLRNTAPKLDMYRLIRSSEEETAQPMTTLVHAVSKVWADLKTREAEGKIRLDPTDVAPGDANAIVRLALRHFGSYHSHAALYRRGDRVLSADLKLLYYYSNRLRHHGLEASFERFFREQRW